MAHDPHPAHLTRRHLLQLLGAGAGIGLLPLRRRRTGAIRARRRGRSRRGLAGDPRQGTPRRLERNRHPRDVSRRRAEGAVAHADQGRLSRDRRSPTAACSSSTYVETQRPRGTERALALDEKTGKILWTQEWDGRLPRHLSTADRPARDADRRRRPRLRSPAPTASCSASTSKTGAIVWKKDYVADYGADRRSGRSTGDSPARRSSTATA